MLMQALLFAPKFISFSGCMTMGDIMGQLYKSPGQIITGILGFFTATCIAGMELTVIGIIGEVLLGIDFRFGVFNIAKIKRGPAVDDADADGRDVILDRGSV
jgi:Na+/proline symporter